MSYLLFPSILLWYLSFMYFIYILPRSHLFIGWRWSGLPQGKEVCRHVERCATLPRFLLLYHYGWYWSYGLLELLSLMITCIPRLWCRSIHAMEKYWSCEVHLRGPSWFVLLLATNRLDLFFFSYHLKILFYLLITPDIYHGYCSTIALEWHDRWQIENISFSISRRK